MSQRVLIIGAGLAGLSAAQALAPRGFSVCLLEARPRLGGRAGSFIDAASGEMIDTCQHVSMGCCTNFAHFCKAAGIDHLLRPQRWLYFLTPDRRLSALGANGLPAPFHLAGSFLGSHHLSLEDKLRIAWGLARLRQVRHEDDPPFLDWLRANRQTARGISRFWGLVLTSALNEDTERVGLRYARKVFIDGFLGHRQGFEVMLPTVPLGRLYGVELTTSLQKDGAEVRTGTAVRRLLVGRQAVQGVELRSGEVLQADWYVSAVPFHRLGVLLPPELGEKEPYFSQLANLETSPITSVHLWYDQPILRLPHVVLVDCLGQWVFQRPASSAGEHYVQVVVSAARMFRALGHDEVQRRIVAELGRLFPLARSARLRRSRVVTEQAATFSAVPGVDRWRPAQGSPLHNLLVAGDWTATGWPATMEGAVRSGYLASQELLARKGIRAELVQPDL